MFSYTTNKKICGRIIDNLQIDNLEINNRQIGNLQNFFGIITKNFNLQIYNLQITCISWYQIYIFKYN